MNAVLQSWNQMDDDSAIAEIVPCCGSLQWATELARCRPIEDETTLLERAETIWLNLKSGDWDEAFATHPRIGQREVPAGATAKSAHWSAEEQGGITDSDTEIHEQLNAGNTAYEERFGRTYIVCATGKSALEMLAILQRRMKNDAAQELQEAVEQQRQITRLRLRKWLRL